MKNRNSGFTLVELMVVVLLVALLGLVATQIPLFSFSSWTKGSKRLKLQRDANLAMIKIQRKLRPASNEDVPDLYTLVIDRTTGEKFFWDTEGKQLKYVDPPEPEEIVMEGDAVTLFNVTTGDEVINIKLKLEQKNIGTVVLETTVKPRN